jgi:uncharacterized SAM-binding protein YcdF (DUF218 family)
MGLCVAFFFSSIMYQYEAFIFVLILLLMYWVWFLVRLGSRLSPLLPWARASPGDFIKQFVLTLTVDFSVILYWI